VSSTTDTIDSEWLIYNPLTWLPALVARFHEYNAMHAGSVIAYAMSYVTTLWAVQWVTPGWRLQDQSVAAVLVEYLFFALKTSLSFGVGGVGWVGVALDSVTNMGGILPAAPRVLSWPPIAIVVALVRSLLGKLGVPTPNDAVLDTFTVGGAPLVVTYGGLSVSLAGGILLSAAGHRMWDAAEAR
jgi:hypothetical protein